TLFGRGWRSYRRRFPLLGPKRAVYQHSPPYHKKWVSVEKTHHPQNVAKHRSDGRVGDGVVRVKDIVREPIGHGASRGNNYGDGRHGRQADNADNGEAKEDVGEADGA